MNIKGRAEIMDTVGDKIDVICGGGIQRGTHVLKALSLGAKACSGGRLYLYALAGPASPAFNAPPGPCPGRTDPT